MAVGGMDAPATTVSGVR